MNVTFYRSVLTSHSFFCYHYLCRDLGILNLDISAAKTVSSKSKTGFTMISLSVKALRHLNNERTAEHFGITLAGIVGVSTSFIGRD